MKTKIDLQIEIAIQDILDSHDTLEKAHKFKAYKNFLKNCKILLFDEDTIC